MEAQAPTVTQTESPEQWHRFLERLGDFNTRLIAELESCWLDLRATLEGQLQRLDAFSIPDLNQPGVEAFQKAREQISERFLLEPLARWERKRPYKRALKAIETYDQNVDDLIGSLPQSVPVNGKRALELFGEQSATRLQRAAARLRRKQRPLPLEALVADEMRKLSVLRLDTEGEYLLVVAEGVSRFKTAWEIARAALDASVKGEPLPSEDLTAWREELKRGVKLLAQRAENALSAWRKQPEIIIQRLTHRIFSTVAWEREATNFDSGQTRAAYVNHWVEQLRAIENEIRLEPELQSSEDRILGSFRERLESLHQERTRLLDELDEVIAWLRKQIQTGTTGRAIAQVSRSFAALSSRAVHNLPGAIEHLALNFLVYIGRKPAPQAGKMEIVTRPCLPREFVVDLAAKELPAIYRRLFRFEAVHDPMFLVGREREMAAIAQARSFWEAGRPAAIIVAGERGSGKTSLINCALKRSLEGLEVIRGEFKQRLLNESQLREFLAEESTGIFRTAFDI